MKTESTFIRHVPCEPCGSSDNASLYTDGHTYCHVCKTYTHADGSTPHEENEQPRMSSSLIDGIEFIALDRRKLTLESAEKWRYGIGEYSGQKVQVACYMSNDGRTVIAQKVRFANKDFRFIGDAKNAGLYGQHLWRSGGKMVVVTEGEIDAITMSQIQEHRWPVVSLPTGAGGAKKAIAASLEWLEKFEKVVLMFDMDDPGQKAAVECAELLTPGKAHIATLPLKDPNDCLKDGRVKELIDAMWAAKPFRPDGVVAGIDLWERIIAPPAPGQSVAWPYPKLTEMTGGMRLGEVIMVAAGSGIGKSEVVSQVYYSLLMSNPDERLGLIHLEEQVEHTAKRLMGLHIGKRLTVSTEGVSEAAMRQAYDATVGNGRVFFYDHFGSADSDNLFAKIRYFAKGCGCSTIVLDHISMVVSGIEDGDERRIIDNLMTKVATMAQELRVRIILITHLKKPKDTPHEEGGRVSLDDFRGSGAIKQLTHTAIGLERNQQDPRYKRFTLIRLLKCRITGQTGEADWLEWDGDTGRLMPCAGPDFGTDDATPFGDGETTNKDF